METTQTNLLWEVRDASNSDAWVRFYRIYASLLRHFLRRLGLTEADAEDVTHEVLVVAHKSLQTGQYDPAKGRFRAWLYGIARRRALAALRAARRRTRAQMVPGEHSGGDLLDQLRDRHESDIFQLWEQEWRYALLDEGLRYAERRLGGKAFEAFKLYVEQRWSVERVAEELGIAPASVYVYKNRVLNVVREWVRQFEEEDEA